MPQFNRSINSSRVIKRLEADKPILITEFYSNGLTLLSALQTHLKTKYPNETFQEQREYRAAYKKLSNLIYIEVKGHELAVKKAPSIGWLAKLYPETPSFLLSFPQIQVLNGAWQWYKNGVDTPVLRNKIYPYYGVYFSTRFDRLIIFDNWLKRYQGSKKSAINICIGSGVLSLQMVKHGF